MIVDDLPATPTVAGTAAAARLGRLMIDIRAAENLGGVLGLAGECLAEITPAHRVDNMYSIPPSGDVRFRQVGGVRHAHLETELTLPAEELPMRQYIRRGELVSREITPATSGAAFDLLERAGMRHMLLVPLTAGGRTLGAVRMSTALEDGFDEDAQAIALHVSYLISGWMMRRQLENRLQHTEETANRYASRLELLNDSAEAMALATSEQEVFAVFGATASQIMGHDRLFFATVSTDGETLVSRQVDAHGLTDDPPIVFDYATSSTKWIMDSGQVTHIADVSELPEADAVAMYEIGMRSSLNVPVRSDGRVAAQLVLGSTAYEAFDTEDTQVIGMLARLTGATLDRVRVTAQLEHRARHDGLTSLANRAEFDRVLGKTLEEVEHSREHATLCYLDLDHFKQINDTYGHAAGDALLVELASHLRINTTQGDLVARIGGDEFVILLRDCGLDAAERVIERLRAWVDEHGFAWEGDRVSISLSAGIAPITPGTTADELLRAADAACYRAKKDGRNRVVQAPWVALPDLGPQG